MSIPNLFHKIKSKIDIDKVTLIYLFIIVGVGIGSFGLGRLSNSSIYSVKSSNMGLNDISSTKMEEDLTGVIIAPLGPSTQREKRYVASKNGKMYYSVECSGVSRIKDENKVWFATASDAEKSGFTFASSCK